MTTSTPSPLADDIFVDLPPEWWHGQEMSSAHNEDSIKPFDLGLSYLLIAYPRDGTPVCTGELIALQQNLNKFSIQVVAASTDSPETHNRFFNDEVAFPPAIVPNIEYPVLTIKENILTPLGKTLLLNKYGYCRRVAIIVKGGAIRGMFETDGDVARDMNVLDQLVDAVLLKADA